MRNQVLFPATQLHNTDEQLDGKMAVVLVHPFSMSLVHPTQENCKEHMV